MEEVLVLWRHLAQRSVGQALARDAIQIHALKSKIMQRPAVQRRNSINANPIQTVSGCLKKRDHIRAGLPQIQQKVFVADFGEPFFFLRLR